MLIDGRTIREGSTINADVCIVGTGMGAISTANDLVKAGWDVVLIEAGAVTANSHRAPAIETEAVGHPFRLTTSRGLEVGGGTNFWHGLCAELDESDFETRDWIPHSGWPIDRRDLATHYERAWKFLCGGNRSDHAQSTIEGSSSGLAADRMERKAYQYQTPAFRGKPLLLDWCKKQMVRCITNSVALQLVYQAGNVTQLIVGSGTHRFNISGRRFIISAGALETPRLLLNSAARSGMSSTPTSWWLGRNLIDHPASYQSQIVFNQPLDSRISSGIEISSNVRALLGYMAKPGFQRAYSLPNHALFIRPGYSDEKLPNQKVMSFLGVRHLRDLKFVHIKALLTSTYIRRRVLHQRLGLDPSTIFGDMFFMTEQLPNPSSRVELSEHKYDRFGFPVARVNWQLSPDDITSFQKFHDLVLESIRESTTVFSTRTDTIAEWAASVSSAAHHLGTARMAHAAKDGVVDRNLKMFTSENVWICDGSVFPTAGSANPSLTICALGHRLASQLIKTGR
jgi:choline dehydrogenase-like flavoprotein